MVFGKLGLFAVAGGEEEGHAHLQQAVGDREAVAVSQIDVEHRQGRRRAFEDIESALDGRGGIDAVRAQAAQDILGIQRDDEAVFNQHDLLAVQNGRRRCGGVAHGGAREAQSRRAVAPALRDMPGRDAQAGDHAVRRVVDRGLAAQVIGNRAVDDGRAEALARRRLDGRAALLAPFDQQVAGGVALPVDVDGPAVGKAAVLGGVGDQFMDHQGHGRIGLGVEQDVAAGGADAVGLVGQEGGGLGVDQGLQRGRAPVIVRDLVVGARQGVDASVDQLDEAFDGTVVRLGLSDQAADDAQDVAHPVVQLGDQQFLALVGLLALLRGLIGHAQDDLDQGGAQGLGHAEFGRGEGAGATLDRLLPFREALAGGQARAVGTVFDRLVRIATPRDRADQLGAEQDHEVGGGARDGYGEQARRGFRELVRAVDQRADVVSRIDAVRADLGEAGDDAAEVRRTRGLTREGMAAIDPDADAVGRNGVGQDLAQPVGVVQQGVVRGHGAEQLIGDVAGAAFELDQFLALAAFEPHREHLGQEFADRAPLEGRRHRRIVMAGEQAPELVVHDDRDRHGGAHAHVSQIFDVDRRDAAQDRKGQVQRPSLLVQHRPDGHRFGVDVGDDAEQVAAIELPRLGRDVRGRIVHALEAADAGPARFGHDLAGAVRRELVDHHPVEAGQGADQADALVEEAREVRRLIQAGDHGADGVSRVAAGF